MPSSGFFVSRHLGLLGCKISLLKKFFYSIYSTGSTHRREIMDSRNKTLLVLFYVLLKSGGMVLAQNSPIDFETGGYGATWTWTVFENGGNPSLEIVTNPNTGDINSSATVAKFTALQAGQPWAGCESLHGSDIGTFSLDATNSTLKIMVYKTIISDVGLKFVIPTSGSLGEIKVANTVTNAWEELTFDFSSHIGLLEAIGIDQIVVFPDFNLGGRTQDNIIYFDNISFSPATVPGLPAEAAPTPTLAEANVISIFSDEYTNIDGVNLNPAWGQSTVVTEMTIEGNNTLLYTGLNYQGTEFIAKDVSGMTYLHIDYWTDNSTALNFFVISQTPTVDSDYHTFAIVSEQWASVDIPLTTFPNVDLTDVFQFKVEGNGTIYWDNFYFYSNSVGVIDYQTGWNMVGLPLEVEDTYYQTLFPDAFNNAMYSFNGSYSPVEYLVPGTGYLIRLSDGGTVEFSGAIIDELTLSLTEGWNLISGISTSLPVDVLYNSGLVVSNGIYAFDGSYYHASTIDPGMGYWVRALADGDVTLSSSSSMGRTVPIVNHFSDANTLELSNGTHSATLYFGKDVPEGEALSYSLPPTFPQMAFDARFTDNMRYAKDLGEISVINTNKDLTLNYTVNIHPGDYMEWVLVTDNGEEYILTGTDEIVFNQGTTVMTLTKRAIIPQEYTLHQNYPNPFNPITSLSYNLPEQAQVTLTIYDLIGREVTQLVNTTQEAGHKSVQWNATDSFGKTVSAGVYFYQIKAGRSLGRQKIVLVK